MTIELIIIATLFLVILSYAIAYHIITLDLKHCEEELRFKITYCQDLQKDNDDLNYELADIHRSRRGF